MPDERYVIDVLVHVAIVTTNREIKMKLFKYEAYIKSLKVSIISTSVHQFIYLFIYLYVLFQQGGSISGQTLFFKN